MEVKPGYKQTEIGVIPEDWEVRFLLQVCKFRGGKAHEPFVSEYGDYVCVNSKFISSDGKIQKKCTINLCPGKTDDILMVMSDLPNGKALAKAFVVDKDEHYAVNQRICALSPYASDSRYLYYVLNRMPYFLSFDDGVSQTHLLNPVFQKCRIPLPPIKEQTKIANTLSDIDTLITSLEKLIEKKKNIKKGVMQELLTGKRRLPGFSGDWESCKLGEVVYFINGYAFQSFSYASDGQYGILTIANVQDGFVDPITNDRIDTLPKGLLPHHLLKLGDILISMTGNVGRVGAVNTDNLLLNQRVGKLVPHSINSLYLFYVLYDYKFRMKMISSAQGGAQDNIGKGDILGYQIPLPSKEEQDAIAKVLEGTESEISSLYKRLSKYRKIKQGMMQELLTGRIRLI